MDKIACEVCIDSVESAKQAQQGGAIRVELCDNLFEGGTTPSAGMIYQVKKAISIKLHVMIRPRSADFCYTEDEFEVMKHDIQVCKQYGVDGVVFGILLPNGDVDVERTRQLVELAKPMSVTFHRAIDMTRDVLKALNDIMTIDGIQRILTSGGESSCLEGLDTLCKMCEIAQKRIIILPGGGITAKNISKIISQTGVKEFHVSGRVAHDSLMQYRNTSTFMGGVLRPPEFTTQIVDSSKISGFLSKANQ